MRGVVESGAFTGTGTVNQPLGLLATPGAVAVPLAGAVARYVELADMVDAYYSSNADPLAAAWFIHPTHLAKLLETEKTAQSGLFAATVENGVPYICGIRAWPTAYMPTEKVILTDPKNITLIYWRAATLLTNPYSLDTSGAVRLTCMNDCDLVVQHRGQLVIGG